MTRIEPPRKRGPVTAQDLVELEAMLTDPAAIDEVIEDASLEGVRRLYEIGATLATAESLTGGLVGAAITSVPGASQVYRGGVVAYASDLKTQLLGVDEGLLSRVGAVDAEVVGSMAEGVRVRLGADYGLATTGVAGPDSQDGKPPGTLWIGVATPTRTWEVDCSTDRSGDRAMMRSLAVMWALVNLGSVLTREREEPTPPQA